MQRLSLWRSTVPGGDVEYAELRITARAAVLPRFRMIPLVNRTLPHQRDAARELCDARSARRPQRCRRIGNFYPRRAGFGARLPPRPTLGPRDWFWAILTAAIPRCERADQRRSCRCRRNSSRFAHGSPVRRLRSGVFPRQHRVQGSRRHSDRHRFDWRQLRASTGVSVQWLAPLGLFRFSLGFPIHYERGNWKHYGDETEGFQFSIGHAF